MIALPTPHGTLFLLATAASIGVAYVNVGLGSALAAAFFTGVAAASFLTAQFSLFGIRVEREDMAYAVCGSHADFPLRITNATPFPRQGLVVSEESGLFPNGRLSTAVPAPGAQETIFLTRTVAVAHRGHYSLDRITLYGGDPAGIFRKRRVFHLPGNILVMPRTEKLKTLNLGKNRRIVPGQEGRPLAIAGLGREFFGVRAYRNGDEIRNIHWKATAAKRQLMVKEREALTVDHIAILLDASRADVGISSNSNFEFLISAAASIAEHLSAVFCTLNFYVQNGDHTLELHGDATGLKGRILSLLTEISPSDSDFTAQLSGVMEQLEPGTVLYVLALSNPPELADMLELLQERHVHIHWIYAPKQNFPYVDPETPLVLDPAKIRIARGRSLSPTLASCRSDLREVLEQC